MTVFIAAKHAWMPTYCTACENIVHFQKDDVLKGARGRGDKVSATDIDMFFFIECRCGHHIVVTKQ